jgi:hypothetical protein
LVIGRSGSLLWIQCNNLSKYTTFSGFNLSSLHEGRICASGI